MLGLRHRDRVDSVSDDLARVPATGSLVLRPALYQPFSLGVAQVIVEGLLEVCPCCEAISKDIVQSLGVRMLRQAPLYLC